MPREIDMDGFEIIPAVVSSEAVEKLTAALTEWLAADQTKLRGGARHLLRTCPAVAELAVSPEIKSVLAPVLGDGAFPVRGLFFDKNPGANWKVPWHQDLTIAVAGRVDTPGFDGWSVKDGVPHV